MEKLSRRIFWNPFVRCFALYSLKLYLVSLVALKQNSRDKEVDKSETDLVISSLITISVTSIAAIFVIILIKKRDKLHTSFYKRTIGALYVDLNVSEKTSNIYCYTVSFFLRRLLFVIVTVFLFKHP